MTIKTETARKTNKPSHVAYHVTEAQGEAQMATDRIRAYFPHAQGDGGALILEVLPIGFDSKNFKAPRLEA